MFSVEIRVNGSLIIHIYGRNLGERVEDQGHLYEYEVYRVKKKPIMTGNVIHRRENGMEALLALILEAVA